MPYTRQFTHSDWIDNFDRVKAGGPDGFNQHFHSIEAEFDLLGSTINALGVQVAAPVTIALPPILYTNAGLQPWDPVAFQVTTGPNLGTFTTSSKESWGVVPLGLPNGVMLTNLTVTGSMTGAGSTMQTDLYQEKHTDGTNNSVATVNDFKALTIANPVLFDEANYIYYLIAHFKPAGGGQAVLRGFTLTYIPA